MGLKKSALFLMFFSICTFILADTFPWDFTDGRVLIAMQPSNTIGTPNGAQFGTGATWQSLITSGANIRTDVDTHAYWSTACGTAPTSSCGWAGGSGGQGVQSSFSKKWDIKAKIVNFAASTTDAARVTYWGLGVYTGSGLSNAPCRITGGTDDWEMLAFCFDLANDPDWFVCSGDGLDWRCYDTAVGVKSPASLQSTVLRIDWRDMTQPKFYIDNMTLPTLTLGAASKIPPVGSTTLISGLNFTFRVNGVATGTGVQPGISYIKMTRN